MPTARPCMRLFVALAALVLLATASFGAAEDQNRSSEAEKQLLALLRSDAPAAEKAIACKKLAIYGSSAAVVDLAKLLPDPQLSSWARIALEVIPGKASGDALREATDSLEGNLLVGTINSIGVRRDARAVTLLAARLQDTDPEVASAAAVALGRIGNTAATNSLRKALAIVPFNVRSAVAEGCVLCAERMHSEGKSALAVEIYDQIRKADLPKQRILEATRGAILARGQAGIPLLVELLRSPDKKLFQLALGTAREFPGDEIDKALAAELDSASPDRAALIVLAMADRPETVVLPAVLIAAAQGPKKVRLVAISTLGRVGDASCLSTLLDAAVDTDSDLSQTASRALADLAGEKVDAQIVALLPTAKSESYPLLIELVGQRRIEAVPALLVALDHSDQTVRSAALIALGETASLDHLPVLISQVVSPKYPDDAPVAQQALRAASIRMPDREACASELAMALERSPVETKSALLEILSDVGGARALQTLSVAAKSNAPELQDTASRLLGKWNNVDAAPILLDLAETAPQPKYQVRALRGYIGLVRKFAMPEPQRDAMCRKAFDTARQTAEQKLVLDVLKIHPSSEGLRLAIDAAQIPELKEEASQAVLVIARKLSEKGVDVNELLSRSGLEEVKLEIIKPD
ncbi:MAG TPA: HEAT repeat domain-containing protein [Pirellulales bacterium]|nr:HEAT repeat domain-containing protein [Pirellulales bacterium]